MTEVTYHGEFPEGQDEIVQHGVTFPRGKSVNVTDKDVLEKLATNRFFNVKGESEKAVVDAGVNEAENAESDTLRAWLTDHQVPYHHKMKVDTLRKLKADWESAQAKAQEA